ncbi:hypothetical protein C8P68_102380 [Mucilaginibacter yixingensis]|uniref:Uncharacterized protein n=1 Tax=Mucilaginibacter yixingensis TaxID=1295612 RepID=A0A2T5JD12_9SPHI|nr:hypothetical protein [Mucilaginibacter yixingensis]PTQ99555.1 hypothetical protein C8P68_102380 [Mucilaginibacter yixingensis]
MSQVKESCQSINPVNPGSSLKLARICIAIVIGGLALSGITAFPLETELHWLSAHDVLLPNAMQLWLSKVYDTLHVVNQQYPYLSYGTDWLAFAHLMLAILFIGPYIDPVKNIWVLQFGLIAYAAIFALAFVAGPIRQIPLFWTLVDCSFGVFAGAALLVALRNVKQMELS